LVLPSRSTLLRLVVFILGLGHEPRIERDEAIWACLLLLRELKERADPRPEDDAVIGKGPHGGSLGSRDEELLHVAARAVQKNKAPKEPFANGDGLPALPFPVERGGRHGVPGLADGGDRVLPIPEALEHAPDDRGAGLASESQTASEISLVGQGLGIKYAFDVVDHVFPRQELRKILSYLASKPVGVAGIKKDESQRQSIFSGSRQSELLGYLTGRDVLEGDEIPTFADEKPDLPRFAGNDAIRLVDVNRGQPIAVDYQRDSVAS
jgi:hypothetical protein